MSDPSVEEACCEPSGAQAASSGSAGPSAQLPSSPTVRRVDDRMGLAALRVPLSPRTLVTYARDHVTVRTPSQPEFADGNTIDLEAVPAPEELAGWVDRFTDTIGQLGVPHVQLRWERPLGADSGIEESALNAHGFRRSASHVWLVDAATMQPPQTDAVAQSQAQLIAVPAPGPGVADRQWHAAAVLLRYAYGDHPDHWRAFDRDTVAHTVDVQRELAASGRAAVWVASRHGAPVGRVTLTHDRQGLATVSDLVVHPVHRNIGLGSALLAQAVSHHLDAHPDGRVAIVTDGAQAPMLHRQGFVPHATVWAARRG